jgi:rubrerythrin
MSQATNNATSGLPASLEDFMAQALQMELDAAQRYNEFADMMETHNNLEVAQWFRRMAEVEGKHADQIMSEMGWSQAPTSLRTAPVLTGFEAPESASDDELHYLMQPWHVLQLALANEQRAERFFAKLASLASVESVRKAALELQQEEAEHIELVQAWLKKVPQPAANWDQDPDPPRYDS